MPSVGRDLRYGLRLLLKSPGFTAVALSALALGLGAATAIFSVVDAVLLKPLHLPDSDRLLVVWEKNPAQNMFKMFVAGGNYLEWRKQSTSADMWAAFREIPVSLTAGPNGHVEPQELTAQRVSSKLLPMLGVRPVVGRLFREDEDEPGTSGVVLLSYNLWQRRFAGDRTIVGKSVRLSDRNYDVVGVLPRGFRVLDKAADVWLPLALTPADTSTMRGRFLTVLARLRPGITIQQGRAELDTIGERLQRVDPVLNRGYGPSVFGMADELTEDTRQPLLVLMGAVGFLLLMACGNVANLLLVRGNARRREIAVRMAMGASRGRIVTQLLSESLILALAGGALGLMLAWGTVNLLASFGPDSIPRLHEAQLDWRIFLFALAISAATGVLFGLAPALQSSGAGMRTALLETGRGRTATRSVRTMRNFLIVAEVALAVTVLIGAGLLIRSFERLRSADLGFRPDGLLTMRLPLTGTRFDARDRRISFVLQAEQNLSALPGVQSVATVDVLPLAGFGNGGRFAVAGRPVPEQWPTGLIREITPGYFRTMGMRINEGRDFTLGDTATTPMVLILSRELARQFWPGGSPVGSRLLLEGDRQAQVVGVVDDVKADRIQDKNWPMLYTPYPQLPRPPVTFILRSSLPPSSIASAATHVIRQMDADQPVDARPMDQVVDSAVSDARFNTTLLTVFAQIAFVLAAVGVYGVVSYDVSQRINEIGIRLALGASRANVLRVILAQAAILAMGGIAIGIAGAWGLTRLMTGMLYQVAPTDSVTFITIPLLLAAVVLVAGYLPSRRVLALDPAIALRHE